MTKAMASLVLAAGALNSMAWGQAKYPEWPYPMSYDSAIAAPANNKLLFENDKLRLFAVMVRPGEREEMNGQPYPSVYFHDAPLPDPSQVIDTPLDPKSPLNGQGAGHGTAPPGAPYLTCETMAPLAPHRVTNNGSFPIHYYRLEFKRLDGADLPANWKLWYPWMVGPIPEVKNLDPTKLGPPFSKQWPYPIALDAVNAAPNNHKSLYRDEHVRLVEVTERGGSQENLHGHPYFSIFINDTVDPLSTPAAASPSRSVEPAITPLGRPGPYHKGETGDYQLDPTSPTMQRGKTGMPPAGMIAPTCSAATPQSPHAHINGGESPGHFYRFEFFHLDGNDIKTKWRQWYP